MKKTLEKKYFEPYMSSTCIVGAEYDCYICGGKGRRSINALTKSARQAESVKGMFDTLGLYSELVSSEEFPIPDVQLGACDNHRDNLDQLEKSHMKTKKISLQSIVQSLIRDRVVKIEQGEQK